MCENSQSSIEEVISIDEGVTGAGNSNDNTNAYSSIPFSKKAIHQRDADENLFLRFLELDPPADANGVAPATPAIIPDVKSTPDQRRKSTFPKPICGRTPFTITKKLVRINDKGYGFSIVWTHPPRIEKVETGLPADRAGILPGDFVIFVEKHNVVTMPEIDILNLIRSQAGILTMEIFRRSGNRSSNGVSKSRVSSLTISNTQPTTEPPTPKMMAMVAASTTSASALMLEPRPSTACSNVTLSMDASKRRLHLPQVTFSKESTAPQMIEDTPRRFLYQLINREQHFVTALQYGTQRFTAALLERTDLISNSDHKTLFQNIEEILRLSEDIIEQLVSDDHEPQLTYASRVYLSKSNAFCAAYKKYCNGLKRADCVLVNKSRHSNSDFVTFINIPQVPRKRPDLTTFIHRPLHHFREVLKFTMMITSHCRPDTEEFRNFSSVISALQIAYREITVTEGLMEPLGEGRPLLTLQDLEARLVFTKCKPFILNVPGRQWIFGGDLSRVENRSVKPYWTLLFSDILLFAKVSRDRVLFITEEPISLINIVDSSFNIRKKSTEFRITIDPNGRLAESPTAHCAPDLSRTPKKNSRRRTIALRAPSPEMKAVWQNLLQRQIYLVNATVGSTLSSPLESPDILRPFLPLCEIGAATNSMASIKLSSADSINIRNQQVKKSKVSKQIEEIIDEKCRTLNKTGTSKGSAIHLAQWMKGQLDNSQSSVTEAVEAEADTEQFEEWSQEQLRKRSKELQLVDENGQLAKHDIGLRCESRMEEITLSEIEEESKSASRSTTSDSQITVRSSPIANAIDKISVCRHCHKNCKLKLSHSISNSLKVQHSQSSPNRCCQSINNSSSNSQKSISSTLTDGGCSSNSQLSKEVLIQSRTSLHNGYGESSSSGTGIGSSDCKATPTKYEANKSGCNINNNSNSNNSSNHNSAANTPCKCKCNPEDFKNVATSSHELRKETCKILNNVTEINFSPKLPNRTASANTTIDHKHCKCSCGINNNVSQSDVHVAAKKKTNDTKNTPTTNNINDNDIDDWSLMLIGLAQLHPAAKLVQLDPFETVPTISVVPPTPEGLLKKFNAPQMLFDDTHKLNMENAKKTRADFFKDKSPENSPDDSPQDEEPPYRTLNTSLKRYGTMSSLEKVSSEDADDKTYNSSDEDAYDYDDDIKIVTKEVYNTSNNASTQNWTNRAGSFLEQSRAFIDSYLGRWEQRNTEELDEETIDECTSGATSGEEVWGTPTSGENDEMQMFNSDQTHSSPTKSSSSLTGDDDTELMMDELLMAPPMSASAMRGLLPRRRLEPLFEEDTESGESEADDLPPDCTSSDQGQVRKIYMENGHVPSAIQQTVTNPTTAATANQTITIEQPEKNYGNDADICSTPVQIPGEVENFAENIVHAVEPSNVPIAGLSPRLEMRLALNNDIMGDEDLICYDPGPDLATILGRDLSTYHRFTGRDLISRSASRVVPKEALISYCQQRNSKMDTPTPNRKKSNQNTWNNSVSVDPGKERKLTDLERLAMQEMKSCKYQLKSGPAAIPSTNRTKNTNHVEAKKSFKQNKFFLSRKSVDNNLSKETINHRSNSMDSELSSSKNDADKSMDRRFWKQLTKRRRSLSVSEIIAS